MSKLVTVVETLEFLSATKKLLDDTERAALVDYLAANPMAGDIMPGTGGVRKLRWALEGRGKRGGARVVFFYHNEGMPLFALMAYAKNQRSDLTMSEKSDLKTVTSTIVERHERKNHGTYSGKH